MESAGSGGALATGIFANPAVNTYTGLIYGNTEQSQVVAVLASVAYAFVISYVLARLVDATIGLRVTEDEEYVGLDIAVHGEKAYA